MNPADLPSRGCSLKELAESRWWEGPSWLREDPCSWPNNTDYVDEELVSKERKKKAIANRCGEAVMPKFSNYLKNVRVWGWIIRFVHNARLKPSCREKSSNLTAEEVRLGEMKLILNIQKAYEETPRNKLCVVKGVDGLLRVKTKLGYLVDSEEFKFPLLLPGGDPVVKLLIELVHKMLCHAGSQLVLSKLRERYWIVKGRRTVDNVINKCVVCRRFAVKHLVSSPPFLPLERVQAKFSFETTGVDLAGPIILKDGKKAWITIYTCAVYRGVLLDLIDSLSSEEFLASLKKFTCTIGRPSTIFSDNGTNFVGANSLMGLLPWKEIEEKFSVNQIKWKFNPPTAAWWGGWWERLIRSLKDLLKRIIGRAKLTHKELYLCLCEVSYVMNERPLTKLNEDPEDFAALTPAHFMRDLPIAGLPEFNYIVGEDLRSAYSKIVSIKESLKARFRKEYLANLVSFSKDRLTPPPKVGDLVLVGSDNKKRFEWPLGKIEEVSPGQDGVTRLLRVKTAQGVLLRPIQRLYPLEVSEREKPVGFEEATEHPSTHEEATDHPSTHSTSLPKIPERKTRSGRKIKSPSYSTWKM